MFNKFSSASEINHFNVWTQESKLDKQNDNNCFHLKSFYLTLILSLTFFKLYTSG